MTRNVILALQWTLATAGALTLTPLVGEILFLMVVRDRLPLWGPLASVAVLGFAVGAAQSIILRRFGPSPAAWIFVTGAAFAVAWFVMLCIAAVLFFPMLFFGPGAQVVVISFVGSAVGGWIIGNRQAALLRRSTPAVEAWVPASVLAWTLCGAIVWIAPPPLPALTVPVDRLLTGIAGHPNSSSMGKFLLGGLLAGAITGTALPIMFSVPPVSAARAPGREP